MAEYLRDPMPYDPTSAASVEAWSARLVGRTLREMTDVGEVADPRRRRGSFGNALEEGYFLYRPNSSPEPDFPEAGLELKSTPVVRGAKGDLRAKERLVLSMIDYAEVVGEKWEASSVMAKARDILLVAYEFEKDTDPLDYRVALSTVWSVPEEDLPQFRLDWELVVGKVRAGLAHEISGSDTVYLEACTKASDSSARRAQPFSDVPAKPRAWAIKASYMTGVLNEGLRLQAIGRAAGERGMGLLDLVRARFEPYMGLTEDELAERLGMAWSGRKPKNLCAAMTKRILGVEDGSEIAEFVRAGVKPKTMRVKRKGVPKEAVSFPAFDYMELAATPFEDSDFAGQVGQKYLLVVYREDWDGGYRLRDLFLWQMPERDVEEARACYEEMRRRVSAGRACDSVKSTENRCCHVRPHGRDSSDVLPVPGGGREVKKSFWLNQGYMAGELERLVESR